MNVLRKILVGLGSVLAVAFILALASPKAVRAVVSTLVTVSNTPANPVPVTEGTDIAEQPFETTICKDGGSGVCATVATDLGVGATPPSSFTVPTTDSARHAVKMLVIKFVSGVCGGPTSSPALLTTVPSNAVDGITTAVNFLNIGELPSTSTLIGQVSVDLQTNIVAGPGSTVRMFANLTGGDGCWLTVNGYLAHQE